ncbi:MAG: NERD domain-containing protein [Nocardioidaceae bacterium]
MGRDGGRAPGPDAESEVVARLTTGLRPGDRMWTNLRVTDDRKDAELDVVLALPDAGFVVLEVKGGQVTHDGERWTQASSNGGFRRRIDPVDQVRTAKYILRTYVEDDPRWGTRGRVRWAHAVVVPHTAIADDFATPDCPRHMIFGRNDLDDLVQQLAAIPLRQESANRPASPDDVEVLDEILRGRGLPQADVIALALERDALADRLTVQQAMLLDVSTLLRRMEIRGGAGSGKTWLAIEQARRLSQAGKRVALVCYSRGLAAYFRNVTAGLPRKQRPAYVGTFHGLGIDDWGAEPPDGEGDSEYWEERLPASMIAIAQSLPDGKKFDAIVVDEAQDFADMWWGAVEAALKDPTTGTLSIFSDEGQRVFARFGGVPECQAVFVLEHNLRNTRQIARTFDSLALTRMRALGGAGPEVRFVACAPEEAIGVADDQVDTLLEEGWRPGDIALLTTGARHPEQSARQEEGQDEYWASYWDADQVFYGHVLGFKGLERRAVVLAVNDSEPRDRAKERLYVGLSRARDALIVCGDLDSIAQVGGEELRRRLTARSG